MELISSLNNKRIKHLIYLLSNKGREEFNEFLVFDIDSVKSANKLNLLKEAYCLEEIKDIKAKQFKVNKEIINKINPASKVIGVISFIPSKQIKNNKVIYLDEISDPSNLGKIIYLMNKYKVKDLILSNKCTSIYNKKCLDYALDNIFNINISYGDISTIKSLKDNGYQILSTGLESSTYLDKVKTKNKFILILGNEARGVNKEILKISDEIIKIDIKNIDSLNVSVASSIIFDNLF